MSTLRASESLDLLLSLPPAMAAQATACEPRAAQRSFFTCDPPGRPLGSGGGTAHLLAAAWQARGNGQTFHAWLHNARKIVVHGGGQSRRLPAYAATGKLFLPMPAFRWALGHRLDQTLLDLHVPLLENIARQAPAAARLLIASGDVLVHGPGDLPPIPDADVVLFGLWTTPEEARHFGVMFTDQANPGRLVTFLQKPAPETIRHLSGEHLFLVDVGIWLLSERAVALLMERCGWDAAREAFNGDAAAFYELYGAWGPHLGAQPHCHDPAFEALTTAVVPLPEAGFHHFGKSRDVIESVYRLQNLVVDQTRLGAFGRKPHTKQFLQNTVFEQPLPQDPNHTLWVENCHIPASWTLANEHVLTNVPRNGWSLRLDPGVCLDFVPVGAREWCVRPYGMDDAFRGPLGDRRTQWLGRPAAAWFRARGLPLAAAGTRRTDLQEAALFPVVSARALTGDFVQWLCAARPAARPALAARWREARRLSATQLAAAINLPRLYAQRRRRREEILRPLAANHARSIFYKLDLQATADLFAASRNALPAERMPFDRLNPLAAVHDRMFRAAVLRTRGQAAAAAAHQTEAFDLLRQAVVEPLKAHALAPRRSLLEDQIIWGRCPLRLDIAGGWSDTPPYCLERGGQVVNVAVNLNGQPPIQVFARLSPEPELVIRSIDQGVEEHVRTYREVAAYNRLGSSFTIARAALALAGFHPDFNGGRWSSLRQQLRAFGGGIELSLLAAVPKGSGLGTSSILAATLLGTLADLGGLGWDSFEIIRRTMALEQLLTSGGGWQDQIGGLLPGAKLIETQPGLEQRPTTRWLSAHFFEDTGLRDSLLLYYTGITRVAHNILGEIVRGIFLNDSRRLAIVDDIRGHARFAYDAMLRGDADGFAEAVRRSWQSNQALDAGTNVPGVQAILDRCAPHLAAAKLLGAGGGGYLLMVARDAAASRAIRALLTDEPPNPKARFVDFSISTTGLQITRS